MLYTGTCECLAAVRAVVRTYVRVLGSCACGCAYVRANAWQLCVRLCVRTCERLAAARAVVRTYVRVIIYYACGCAYKFI